MAEFCEDSCCGPFAGKGEIDTVDEVGVDSYRVADDIDPTDNLIISGLFFPV